MAPIVLVVGVIFAMGCGGKDKKGGTPMTPITTIPNSWGGVWSVRTQVKICGTTDALFDSTIVDTLCPGGSIGDLADLGGDTLCARSNLTGTATSVSFSCTDTLSFEGCTNRTLSVTYNATVNATATAGTVTGTGRIQVSTPGDSCYFCLDIVQNGNRIGTTPAECSAALRGFFRGVPATRSWWRRERR
jgi:hypothetical protein